MSLCTTATAVSDEIIVAKSLQHSTLGSEVFEPVLSNCNDRQAFVGVEVGMQVEADAETEAACSRHR